MGHAVWLTAGVARAAAVVALALVGGPAALPAHADVARAGEKWCEVDPLLVVTTPQGNTVPLFYLTGVQSLAHTPATLLPTAAYTVQPAAGGTRVVVDVTVPDGPLGTAFPTRVTASSGPWGTLTVYGRAEGTSGRPMRVAFHLPVP